MRMKKEEQEELMDDQYKQVIKELEKRGSSPGLASMKNLLDQIGHPERKLKVIHIAGTNGKGSVFAYLSSILKEAGYRVGRYISPTIRSYEERFQIDGKEISPDKLEKYYRFLKKYCLEETGKRGPTLFEVETALAFLYFAEEKTDYALIETGMGGTLDATNVIERPLLTVISSISEDHKAFLGDNLKEIAAHKAGIIKEGIPVVLAENVPEVCAVIKERAREKRADCIVVTPEDYQVFEETPKGSTFIWKEQCFETKLPGRHQISNAVTALTAAGVLVGHSGNGGRKACVMTKENLKEGIKNTRWPGRLELLRENPFLFRDGAHNPDGACKLAQFLEKHFTNKKIIYIMGVLKDKEYGKMLEFLMPQAKIVYTFGPGGERGLPGETLAEAVKSFGVKAENCANVNEAMKKALDHAEKEEVLVVCGSLSFMEDMEVEIWK